MFFGPIRKTRWLPWPLIGWDIFDFSLNRTQQNLTGSKISMSPTMFVFYRRISKQKCPPWPIPQKGGTLYSGARYVALWASCYNWIIVFCNIKVLWFSFPEKPLVQRPRPIKLAGDFWKIDNKKYNRNFSCQQHGKVLYLFGQNGLDLKWFLISPCILYILKTIWISAGTPKHLQDLQNGQVSGPMDHWIKKFFGKTDYFSVILQFPVILWL